MLAGRLRARTSGEFKAKDDTIRPTNSNTADSDRKVKHVDDEGKKGGPKISSNKAEEITKNEIREKFSRCPFAIVELTVKGGSKSPSDSTTLFKQSVDAGGLVLTSKQNALVVPGAPGPEWAYKQEVKTNSLDFFPIGAALIIHPGEQRYFLRQRMPNQGVNVLLDITQSERDRITLHDGMEFEIMGSKTGKPTILRFEIPLGGTSDASSSWHKRIEEDELWRIRQRKNACNVATFSPLCTHDIARATNTVATSVSTDKSSRSVHFLDDVVSLTDDTRTNLKNSSEEEEPLSANSSEEGTLSPELLMRRDAAVFLDGKELLRLNEHGLRKCIFFGISATFDLVKDTLPKDEWSFVALDCDESFCLAVCLELGSSCMLLPRYNLAKMMLRNEMLLRVPSDVVFPLITGDAVIVRQDKTSLCCVKFQVPKLSRSPPTDSASMDAMNPAHFLRVLAVEASQQPTSSSSAGRLMQTLDSPKPLVFNNKKFFTPINPYVRVGRQETDIQVTDPHLSRHHATIERVGKAFLMSPSDSSRIVFILLGKSDSHYRPPTPLRSGDTFSCGKSEFKVVYQQRGNRDVSSGSSAAEELRLRLSAINHELRVKNQQMQQRQEFVAASDAEVDGEVEGMINRFKNLNPMAKETFSGETTAPQFRNLQSLLEHFENRDFGNGPFMILMTTRGPKAKQFFLCDPLETTIGCSPHARVSIDNDKRMSPLHCRVYFDALLQRWMLEDLHSSHGTFLKIEEPTLMATGDVYLMGMTMLRIFGQHLIANQLQQQTSLGRCTTQ